MTIKFDIGDASSPRGHALLYFRDAAGTRVVATYVLVLPIKMDMGKYLPPLLASQLGGMGADVMGEGMSVFAAPPLPEEIEGGTASLERLARLRGDDLVSGGDLQMDDVQVAMQAAAEVVQEYSALYQAGVESGPAIAIAEADRQQDAAASSDVHRVLFELLSDRDRLAELAKLVGTLRFATEQDDKALASDADNAMMALSGLLPDHYWVSRIRVAACDMTKAGDTMARLLIDRCYKLMDEDFASVEEIERQIDAANQ